MTQFRSYKYKLSPTSLQKTLLNLQLSLCCDLYNAALEERICAYRHSKTQIGFYEQCTSLLQIKQDLPEYKNVNAGVLQETLYRLHKAYQNFFRRIRQGEKPGFPRFKSKSRYSSFTYPQSGFQLNWGLKDVKLSKIGKVKIRGLKTVHRRIKTVTVTKSGEDWFITFACEVSPQSVSKTGESIGIDVGISHFVTTSKGEHIDNPRFYRSSQSKLRRSQRSFSRKQKGSKRQSKAKLRVTKCHRKIARQRADFHHKLSRRLVNENDLIAIEDLNIAGMVRSYYSRSISDVGWGQFFSMLTYKAEWAGKRVVRVDPKYTSQTCSQCQHVSRENRLSQSEFKCVQCGYTANADVNAAMNILARAELSMVNVVH